MANLSMEDILRQGEQLYLNELKHKLEAESLGHYAVIDPETGKYVVRESQIDAVEAAKHELGEKLFYILKIGSLERPTINHRVHQEYAWNF